MAQLIISPSSIGTTNPCMGYVFRAFLNGQSFSDIRTGAGTYGEAFDSVSISRFCGLRGDGISNFYDMLYRGIICFDTSSLPDDAIITSATISIYSTSKSTDLGSCDIEICSSSPSSTSSLSSSDYSYTNFGSTSFSSISLSSWNTNSYNNFSLNSSGISHISKTGITCFGVVTSWDLNNNFTGTWAPGVTTSIQANLKKDGNDATKLTINYTSGATFTPQMILT